MNWLKKTLADVAGTQEPIYGPEAIQPVTKQAENISYTELTKDDLKWIAPQHTCVETQTFYVMADNGALCFIQVIYSNVMGLQTTASFNSKIYSVAGDSPHIWHTDTLHNVMFDPDMYSFGADNLALTLNDEGTSYTIKSAVNDNSLVNLTFTRKTPGLVIGKNGTSFFGTDPQKPWGSMRHAFWPRCSVEGTITTKEKTYDFTGRGFFVYALQGMKPHHAAARWNFVNMQTPSYSAFMMEFTTPPSYGSTVVNVGGIIENDKILYAGATNVATHVESTKDSENDWPEPKTVKYVWGGTKTTTKAELDTTEPLQAELEGSLGKRLDRIDVMAEVPGFVKSIVGSVAGTRPYIYQYYPKEQLNLKVKVGDKEVVEQGLLFAEATFIC